MALRRARNSSCRCGRGEDAGQARRQATHGAGTLGEMPALGHARLPSPHSALSAPRDYPQSSGAVKARGPPPRQGGGAAIKTEDHIYGCPSMTITLQPAHPDDRKLTLSLPAGVVRQLRDRMAHEETTLRALILEALRDAGYVVPAGRDPRPPPARPRRRLTRYIVHGPPMTEKQVDLFLDSIVNAPMKDDRALMEFPFFSLQKAPRLRPLVYDDGKVKIEVRPGDRGIATIWDKDVLIYIALDHQRPARARPAGREDGPLQRPQPAPGDRPRLRQAGLRAAARRHVPPALDHHRDHDRGRRDQGAARLRLDRDLPRAREEAAQERPAGHGGLRDHAQRLDVPRHRQGPPGADHQQRLFPT